MFHYNVLTDCVKLPGSVIKFGKKAEFFKEMFISNIYF